MEAREAGSENIVPEHLLSISIFVEKIFRRLTSNEERVEKVEEEAKTEATKSDDLWEWVQQGFIHVSDSILSLMESNKLYDTVVRNKAS